MRINSAAYVGSDDFSGVGVELVAIDDVQPRDGHGLVCGCEQSACVVEIAGLLLPPSFSCWKRTCPRRAVVTTHLDGEPALKPPGLPGAVYWSYDIGDIELLSNGGLWLSNQVRQRPDGPS